MSDTNQIVSCPGCQSKMSIPPTGQIFRCPKCGKQIQVRKPVAKSAATAKSAPQSAPVKPMAPVKPSAVVSGAKVPNAAGTSVARPGLSPPRMPSSGGVSSLTGSAKFPAQSSSEKKSSHKKLALLAAGVGSTVLTCCFLFLVWYFAVRPTAEGSGNAPGANVPPAANVAAAPAGDPAIVADPQAVPEMPEKRGNSPNGTPYVGLDQIIYKPGETLGPAEEGSGKRIVGVGKSMQPNEVRTVMWRITAMAGGGDRQALGDQKLQTVGGYVPGSLVIDKQKQVVLLKYKGTVLSARDYRTILELETEISLDPEPHFP